MSKVHLWAGFAGKLCSVALFFKCVSNSYILFNTSTHPVFRVSRNRKLFWIFCKTCRRKFNYITLILDKSDHKLYLLILKFFMIYMWFTREKFVAKTYTLFCKYFNYWKAESENWFTFGCINTTDLFYEIWVDAAVSLKGRRGRGNLETESICVSRVEPRA